MSVLDTGAGFSHTSKVLIGVHKGILTYWGRLIPYVVDRYEDDLHGDSASAKAHKAGAGDPN
jgi:hypothetical protein